MFPPSSTPIRLIGYNIEKIAFISKFSIIAKARIFLSTSRSYHDE